MSIARQALAALALACSCAGPALASPANTEPSFEARVLTRSVLASGDHRGRPFAVVDKKDARLFLFDAHGQLVGATPVLLGLAKGDHAAPGIGNLPVTKIPLADRTTPAGRFASEPGRNLQGEDIVWLDYDADLAIHRLRPAPAEQARPERMASANANRHRISAGCVVVPVPFYEAMVQPTLGRQRGTVYVLPEERSMSEVFAGLLPPQLAAE